MEARRKELRQCGIVFRLQGPCEPADSSDDVFAGLEKAAAPLVDVFTFDGKTQVNRHRHQH